MTPTDTDRLVVLRTEWDVIDPHASTLLLSRADWNLLWTALELGSLRHDPNFGGNVSVCVFCDGNDDGNQGEVAHKAGCFLAGMEGATP